MERITEMVKVLEEEFAKALSARILHMEKMFTKETDVYIEEFCKSVEKVRGNRSGSLAISYLSSSYLTESHKFLFSFYEGELFVEEEPSHAFFVFPYFFDYIKEDEIKRFERILRKQFIRIFPMEIEEIRRIYMRMLYEKCEIFFRRLVDYYSEGKDIKIYFGSYMSKATLISKDSII